MRTSYQGNARSENHTSLSVGHNSRSLTRNRILNISSERTARMTTAASGRSQYEDGVAIDMQSASSGSLPESAPYLIILAIELFIAGDQRLFTQIISWVRTGITL
jgi:hypothetical protein